MIRASRFLPVGLALTLLAAGPALAQQQRVAAPAARPAEAAPQATLLATYDDWGAYASQQGRTKVCYALAQPKSRQPANLTDTPAYLFVSSRPNEKIRNEVSVVANFDLKEEVDHQAQIGDTQFTLAAKGQALWVKNPAEEARIVDTMRRGAELEVKGTSRRNNPTSDRYSLKGFTAALERVQKECP